MYGIYRFSDSVSQIVLPPHDDTALPWGYPHAVYVLHGTNPVLVDTGHGSAEHALLDALRVLEVTPERVHRILLTGTSPSCVGNLKRFPRALPVRTQALGDSGVSKTELELERLELVVSELLCEPNAPSTWKRSEFDAFAKRYRASAAVPEDMMIVADGDAVAAAGFMFDTLSVGGALGTSTVYYAADKRYLFGSDIVNVSPRPILRDSGLLLDSLRKLASLSTGTLFPAHGAITTQCGGRFRSAHLYTTNLRTNLQYLLRTPSSAAELAAGDIGYWPVEFLRFAGLTVQYRQLLEEMVLSGVAIRDEVDGRIKYRMGTEQGRQRLT